MNTLTANLNQLRMRVLVKLLSDHDLTALIAHANAEDHDRLMARHRELVATLRRPNVKLLEYRPKVQS